MDGGARRRRGTGALSLVLLGTRLGWAEMGRNARRSGLSIFSITLGIASVLIMNSLTEGNRRMALEQIARMGGVDVITVTTLEPSDTREEIAFARSPGLTWFQLRSLEASVPDVERLLPQGNHSAREVRGPRGPKRTHAIAVSWAYFTQFNVSAGDFLLPAEEMERSWDQGQALCLLGERLAADMFPQGNSLGSTIEYSGVRLKVAGIVHGSSRLDWRTRLCYYPWPIYFREFAGPEGRLGEIQVKVRDPLKVDATVAEVRNYLLKEHRGVEDFTISTPEEQIEETRKANFVMTLVGNAIASLALGVGGIGILNLMLATVSGRIREIGVRKALGATDSVILAQFLAESVSVAVLGTAAGLALGTAPLLVPGGVLPIEPTLKAWDYILSAGVGSLTGLLAGVYPALKAARLAPVEALRHG